jgi:hypothetical protein
LLHNKNLAKKAAPKYPPNPFHIELPHLSITWSQYVRLFDANNEIQQPEGSDEVCNNIETGDLIALGSLNTKLKAEQHVAPQQSRQYHPARPDGYYPINMKSKKESYFSSLKSQLWIISVVLLSGIISTMVVTVVSLSRQGVTWMSTSATLINSKQIACMQAITLAKSSFVKVLFISSHNR